MKINKSMAKRIKKKKIPDIGLKQSSHSGTGDIAAKWLIYFSLGSMEQGFSQWIRWEQGQQTLGSPEKRWAVSQALLQKQGKIFKHSFSHWTNIFQVLRSYEVLHRAPKALSVCGRHNAGRMAIMQEDATASFVALFQNSQFK